MFLPHCDCFLPNTHKPQISVFQYGSLEVSPYTYKIPRCRTTSSELVMTRIESADGTSPETGNGSQHNNNENGTALDNGTVYVTIAPGVVVSNFAELLTQRLERLLADNESRISHDFGIADRFTDTVKSANSTPENSVQVMTPTEAELSSDINGDTPSLSFCSSIASSSGCPTTRDESGQQTPADIEFVNLGTLTASDSYIQRGLLLNSAVLDIILSPNP